MKRIILGLILICCSCEYQPAKKSKDIITIDGNDFIIRTIDYKQHEYVLFTGTYKGSLCHSESCKCKLK